MSRIAVIGAGPVGAIIASELLRRGHQVCLISERWPGDGITGDFAAGIGCIFKPSSALVGKMVLDSYPEWMVQARDTSCDYVQLTRISVVVPPDSPDPVWKDNVEDFRRDSNTQLSYLTYSFAPVAMGRAKISQFVAMGGVTNSRPITSVEVSSLRQGRSLEGFSYTVATMGLELRAILPRMNLFPVRGVLVHFFNRLPRDSSFMDENAVCYAVSRPGGCVIGSTFDEYVGTCSPEEQLIIGQQIVNEANRRFSLTFDFANRERVTVGYRPATEGNPIIDIGDELAVVNGMGGQGWVIGHSLVSVHRPDRLFLSAGLACG
jgi:glycine/D-amino acid oxidase-like deaminating enzyme